MRWLLLGLSLLPAQAAVFYIEAANSPISATNIVDPMTGADLGGVQVTANYVGFSVAATFQVTGSSSGAAVIPGFGGPLFSVSVTGPTEAPLAWQYTSQFLSPLLSLVLDGSAASVFFDRTGPNPGVAGSGPGLDMAFAAPVSLANILVTYDRPVNYAGSPHDLFGKVTFSFPGVNGNPDGLAPQNFSFTQDSDQTVPEPGSGMLLGIGAGLLGLREVLRRLQ
ncbi:MAG: PEP-CTERM sorting domain-containing protein [Acidobacteria bacterium]|nr:PEP-CTERM sorting domain-containing protein [Acidobacteriota bacterium]